MLCCLLTLLMIGHPPDLLALVPPNQSAPGEEAVGETEMIAPKGGAPRSSSQKGAVCFAGPPKIPSALLDAGCHCPLLISARPVDTFAKRNGVGPPMRC